MKALVVEGVKQLNYKDIERPVISAQEVLVRVKACGICGSDIPRVKDGSVHQFPIVVGHEFSGEVAEVGIGVGNCKIGDRVTVAPLVPCGQCDFCRKGKTVMCTSYSFIGSRCNGAMAEYVAVPAANIIPIAENVTFEQAACIEPITVALHGVERIAVQSGKSALVYGCGTIGNLVIQCLKAKGLERIYAVDIDDFKLEMAKRYGAFETINALTTQIPTYIEEIGKVDYVFETAGINFIQSEILSLVKKSGSVVYIGTAHKDVVIPARSFESILRGELNITGSWMSYSAPFPGTEWVAAAEYLASGKICVDGLVTHRFSLEDGYSAFETMLDKGTNALKVMYVLQ